MTLAAGTALAHATALTNAAYRFALGPLASVTGMLTGHLDRLGMREGGDIIPDPLQFPVETGLDEVPRLVATERYFSPKTALRRRFPEAYGGTTRHRAFAEAVALSAAHEVKS